MPKRNKSSSRKRSHKRKSHRRRHHHKKSATNGGGGIHINISGGHGGSGGGGAGGGGSGFHPGPMQYAPQPIFGGQPQRAASSGIFGVEPSMGFREYGTSRGFDEIYSMGGETLTLPDEKPEGMDHEVKMVPDDGPGGLFPTGEFIPATVETAREEAHDTEPFAGAGYAPPPIFPPIPANFYSGDFKFEMPQQQAPLPPLPPFEPSGLISFPPFTTDVSIPPLFEFASEKKWKEPQFDFGNVEPPPQEEEPILMEEEDDTPENPEAVNFEIVDGVQQPVNENVHIPDARHLQQTIAELAPGRQSEGYQVIAPSDEVQFAGHGISANTVKMEDKQPVHTDFGQAESKEDSGDFGQAESKEDSGDFGQAESKEEIPKVADMGSVANAKTDHMSRYLESYIKHIEDKKSIFGNYYSQAESKVFVKPEINPIVKVEDENPIFKSGAKVKMEPILASAPIKFESNETIFPVVKDEGTKAHLEFVNPFNIPHDLIKQERPRLDAADRGSTVDLTGGDDQPKQKQKPLKSSSSKVNKPYKAVRYIVEDKKLGENKNDEPLINKSSQKEEAAALQNIILDSIPEKAKSRGRFRGVDPFDDNEHRDKKQKTIVFEKEEN